MNDFPPNSQSPKRDEPPQPSEKKVEAVIQGGAIIRKPSAVKRITETFIGGDIRQVAGYVFLDVMLPAARDMVADGLNQGVDRFFYGDREPARRRSRPGASPSRGGYVSYNRYHSGPARREDPRERERPSISRRARTQHDFSEVILRTRPEAELILERLFDILEKFEMVTVADFYDLLNEKATPQDEKYGWLALRGASIRRVRGGYLIDLPTPEVLD